MINISVGHDMNKGISDSIVHRVQLALSPTFKTHPNLKRDENVESRLPRAHPLVPEEVILKRISEPRS